MSSPLPSQPFPASILISAIQAFFFFLFRRGHFYPHQCTSALSLAGAFPRRAELAAGWSDWTPETEAKTNVAGCTESSDRYTGTPPALK